MSLSLTVIGAGRLGKTLARCLLRHELVTIVDVVTRTSASAQAAVDFIGAGTSRVDIGGVAEANLFMLAVPDDQITRCCEQLAASNKIGTGTIIFHCSGALGSAALIAASQSGASVASVHPVRSFADPERVADNIAGTCFGIEGDAVALQRLLPLFEALGCVLVPVQTESKTLYHAAAVFASNYVVSILAVAQEAYVAAGIPADVALKMLIPLTRESIENVLRIGPAAALTGPIVRGDEVTIERQQRAVSAWDSQYGDLYAVLAEVTRRLAHQKQNGPIQPARVLT